MHYIGISTYQFIPCYASAIHKHTHTRILKPFEDSLPTGLKAGIAYTHHLDTHTSVVLLAGTYGDVFKAGLRMAFACRVCSNTQRPLSSGYCARHRTRGPFVYCANPSDADCVYRTVEGRNLTVV